jgi:hypothetical protein
MSIRIAILSAGALLALSSSFAAADVTFKFIPAADAVKMAAAPKTNTDADYVASAPGFRMYFSLRNKPGQVETHMDWNDELIIQDGDVTLNYGGTAVNSKERTPGEWLGDSLQGGNSVVMHAGDVVTIPAGMPHQMIVSSPVMHYIVIKTKK